MANQIENNLFEEQNDVDSTLQTNSKVLADRDLSDVELASISGGEIEQYAGYRYEGGRYIRTDVNFADSINIF